jgi:hypothetical protein
LTRAISACVIWAGRRGIKNADNLKTDRSKLLLFH